MASTMTDVAPARWSIRSPTESETSVYLVRAYLAYLGLPAELVLNIMDLARYYPAVYVKRIAPANIRADGALFSNSAAQLYLVTPPLPRTQDSKYYWAAREIIWHIESRDQKWGGEAPVKYHPAWSRHDACIFRRVESDSELPVEDGDPPSNGEILLHEEVPPENHCHAARDEAADQELPARSLEVYYRVDSGPEAFIRATLEPSRWRLVDNSGSHSGVWPLQSNRVAHSEYERHKVVWTAVEVDAEEEMRTVEERGTWGGNGFVQTLRPGDQIGLMLRVMHPRWANDVLQASIEVVYDVR